MLKLQFSGSGFLFVFVLLMFQKTATAHDCPPSSCGGTNISYPFRLQTDPISCGDDQYMLSCENNFTVLRQTNGGKYYVKAIDYDNFTIRLVDVGVDKDDCSSLPSFPFPFDEKDPSYTLSRYKQNSESGSKWEKLRAETINLIKCENAVNSSGYLDTSPCINSSLSHSETVYTYAYFGLMKAYDLRDGCSSEIVSLMLPISSDSNNSNLSFIEVHRQMAFGFELSWHPINCRHCEFNSCYLDSKDQLQCNTTTGHRAFYTIWKSYIEGVFQGYTFEDYGYILYQCGWFLIIRDFWGFLFVATFLFFKWERRHLSGYDTIEEFLQGQNNLMPVRYPFSNIQDMTGNFKEMLGKGGYGSVYKAKLRSGQFAAIKILEKSKAGQDFISEVATLGRIHHANIVRLIGYSSKGSKHALVYDFMSNGSLDRHIFSPERSISLSWEKLYEISLGIARGIEYLHGGCDIQILHFDIKPHNILLDENFTPKISDFGLAKLYPTRGTIASLTAVRGTIGYMAPEIFYKDIGHVSHKADVYSFGKLLLEMSGKRKNLEARADDTSTKNLSQLYYPFLVYEKLSNGNLEIEENDEIVRKMIITGLWCIQMNPSNRPSMNEVVKMLEGDLESLEMPPKPLLCPNQDIPLLTTADFPECSSSQMETPTSL